MIMTYTLTHNDNVIVRDEDNAFIPTDEGNRDYQKYLKWVEEGNQPNPAPAEITPPIQENIPTINELADQVADQEQRIAALEESVTRISTIQNPLVRGETKSETRSETKSETKSASHPKSKR
jgi:hypothetical protein